jgi:hypothetical protein
MARQAKNLHRGSSLFRVSAIRASENPCSYSTPHSIPETRFLLTRSSARFMEHPPSRTRSRRNRPFPAIMLARPTARSAKMQYGRAPSGNQRRPPHAPILTIRHRGPARHRSQRMVAFPLDRPPPAGFRRKLFAKSNRAWACSRASGTAARCDAIRSKQFTGGYSGQNVSKTYSFRAISS